MKMKFIIWGFGKYGKMVLELLGRNRILYFVDNNKKLQNNGWNDINIISPEKMLENYAGELIIITPLKHENEIAHWLKENKIEKYYKLSSEMFALQGFIRQAPHEILLREIDNNYQIIIYGKSILAYCIQDWLFENSIIAIITEDILEISIRSIVILSKKIDEKLKLQIEKQANRVFEYYNLSLQKEYYYNNELTQFHNIYENERCFIVGTGPSLRMEDLDVLSEYHEKSISMNGIFKAFPYTSWRPDYYCLSDINAVRQWKEEILSMEVKEKFITDVAWRQQLFGTRGDFHKWHMYLTWQDGCEPEFSIDLSHGFFLGQTITFDCCIPLAMYMGFKEIVLIGIDCTQYSSEEQQHFVPDYNKEKSKDARLCVEDNILSYRSAKKYADSHGIKIYNATRGGKLEVFERVDFDSLFET